MKFNYTYLAEIIKEHYKDCTILDYGCGEGQIIKLCRNEGIEIYGVDNYQTEEFKETVQGLGYLGNVVKEIKNSVIDFQDDTFDLIINNMVFEHVEDLESVLSEINRVLKDDGTLLCLFPTKEVMIEGHIRMPFIHWFKKGSKMKFCFALLLAAKPYKWVKTTLQSLENMTYYRPKKEIIKLFKKHFDISFAEDDYIIKRLAANNIKLLFEFLMPVYRVIFRRLAFTIIEAKKI
jgi:SAM-dependent methyltransferase